MAKTYKGTISEAAALNVSRSSLEIGNMDIDIGQAQEIFRSTKNETAGFRSLVRLLIDNGFESPFSNDSYLDALSLTEVMLERTNSEMRILSGAGADGFLTILEGTFINALERIQAAKGNARIIVLDRQIPPVLERLQKQFHGTLEVALAKAEKPLQHFITCDSRIVRIEEVHDELTLRSPAKSVHAKVYFNNPSLAGTMNGLFEGYWKVVKAK